MPAVCGFNKKTLFFFLLIFLLRLSLKVKTLTQRHCFVTAPFISAADFKPAHLSSSLDLPVFPRRKSPRRLFLLFRVLLSCPRFDNWQKNIYEHLE